MVGIPGRSKGCATCRKRKKGCDLERPACGQCTERGMPCGGYDSDRIFIYQSGEKSRPDAKTGRNAASRKASSQPVPHSMQMVPVRTAPDPVLRNSRSNSAPFMLPDGFIRSAYSQKTIEAFLTMYNPKGVVRPTNTDLRDFVNILPILSTRDEALQMAVLAIGVTQLGITTGDHNLTLQGKSMYGKALKETAMALRSPTRASSEALLIVPRVMAIFDMLFGTDADTTSQVKSWLSHAEGELALILNRRPEAFADNDEAHLLFTSARYRLLAPAIRGRKATILNNEEWKTIPWKGRIKTPEDILIDIFCGMPELLEAIDKLTYGTMSKERKLGLQVHTVARCWTLHFQLQAWVESESNEAYTPEINDSTTPITFPNIDVACITVRYWITALLLYSSLDLASGIDPATDFFLTHPDRPHPRPFARMIVRSVAYFFQEQFGITGAMAIWMPLGNALWYSSRNRAAEIEYIKVLIQAWSQPNLPSTMREFLVSFRKSVAVGTLVPIPMSEL
ncbi:hypothetical protein EJ02DRAFT_407614 [Clathrospora elynae]|uniref:Zn(2)-C6 fungal-type domain-containing protein n=1 Tax=Clathrospora elynae TaxID=706981 RepID=A0A6A5SKI0_9PLEO|nr:hypothetical protein EJ02DRAFT_407614 [Clathrospora elynae]